MAAMQTRIDRADRATQGHCCIRTSHFLKVAQNYNFAVTRGQAQDRRSNQLDHLLASAISKRIILSDEPRLLNAIFRSLNQRNIRSLSPNNTQHVVTGYTVQKSWEQASCRIKTVWLTY